MTLLENKTPIGKKMINRTGAPPLHYVGFLFAALVTTTLWNAPGCNGFSVEDLKKAESTLPDGGKIWVLLVAGSQGFSNYRHQSDVCHAYHVRIY